ncbi:MAG: DUF3999 domain-containing protein [Proteobacteria bacterium]|nr:DUF3999 domain-containing protein [Pseudomonadota bacterium]MCP4920256.1 DUF3999 domain-containing protein [Pseudomonadota bacterium]
MIALLVGAAWAVEPAAYSQSATLELPESGVARIDLGEAATWPYPDDVVLLDAEGRAVPLMVLDSERPTDREWASVPWDPIWHGGPPDVQAITIDTREIGHPIDELTVHVRDRWPWPWAVPLEVRDERGRTVAEGVVWRARLRHEDAYNDTIEVPELPPGIYTVHANRNVGWYGVRASWGAGAEVPRVELELPVADPTSERSGVSVYRVELPASGLDVRRVVLDVEDARFERLVEVKTRRFDGSRVTTEQLGRAYVERLQIGGADIERLVVDVDGQAGATLELHVVDERNEPLQITTTTVEAVGRHVLVHDVGPGPHTLLAAPVRAKPGGYDLDHAVVELLDMHTPQALLADWGPHAAYDPTWLVPEPLLSGAPARVRRHEAGRALTSPGPGLPTRWVLPDEVVASARSDLGDLRIVDADGDQVPYLLDGGETRRLTARVEQSQVEGRTILDLHFDVPVEIDSILVTTDSRAFSRSVRVGGAGTSQWHVLPEDGAARSHRLVRARTDHLQIAIDDGDDRPLENLGVEAFGPAPAVIAVAPMEGATLYYGDPATSRPDYDLLLFSDLLAASVVVDGDVGAVTARARPEIEDRWLATGGIAALAIGLLFLAARLVRPLGRDEEEPPQPAPDTELAT